jgi:hypothetical protein
MVFNLSWSGSDNLMIMDYQSLVSIRYSCMLDIRAIELIRLGKRQQSNHQ